MKPPGMEGGPPAKRRKLDASSRPIEAAITEHQESLQKGVGRPISPPLSRRMPAAPTTTALAPAWGFDDVPQQTTVPVLTTSATLEHEDVAADVKEGTRYVASPIQLTRIRDLAPHQNVDTVGLQDLLGDPMIKECWNFNFLFDLDFVMSHFDPDVMDIVKVKVIHGFWKKEDTNRIALLEATERYSNIELLPAYIPDPFGTHHTKMLVLFRHDGFAQVVIHTANMISRDWTNMSQAVWRSPLLPLLPPTSPTSSLESSPEDDEVHVIGSGERFKDDLVRYLKAYGHRVMELTLALAQYDFSSIRAAFIGSAPSRQKPTAAEPSKQTSFGWLGLQQILSTVPVTPKTASSSSPPHIIIQISSIATLGAVPTWLTLFQSVLARSASNQAIVNGSSSTAFSKASSFFAKPPPRAPKQPVPKFNVIFPTPEEIRTSLDGYESGHSIHVKLQSAQQQKQLEYLHPLFCHWKHPVTPSQSTLPTAPAKREALRGPAAPHIKTFIRFRRQEHETIDWAMVTSANLSKQAWGDVVNKKDEIWIQSWEAGVVVWPDLFSSPDAPGEAIMVPMFGKDMPGPEAAPLTGAGDVEGGVKERLESTTVVGFRMPYDLPLSPYAPKDKPWCATIQYEEPDWKGKVWAGYQNK